MLQQRQGPVTRHQLSNWHQQLQPQAISVSGKQMCSSQWSVAGEPCCLSSLQALPRSLGNVPHLMLARAWKPLAGHRFPASQSICFCPYSSLLSTSTWAWQLMCQATHVPGNSFQRRLFPCTLLEVMVNDLDTYWDFADFLRSTVSEQKDVFVFSCPMQAGLQPQEVLVGGLWLSGRTRLLPVGSGPLSEWLCSFPSLIPVSCSS